VSLLPLLGFTGSAKVEEYLERVNRDPDDATKGQALAQPREEHLWHQDSERALADLALGLHPSEFWFR